MVRWIGGVKKKLVSDVLFERVLTFIWMKLLFFCYGVNEFYSKFVRIVLSSASRVLSMVRLEINVPLKSRTSISQ